MVLHNKNSRYISVIILILSVFLLSHCSFQPPYNNFQDKKSMIVRTKTDKNGLDTAVVGFRRNTKNQLLQTLRQQDIEYIQYGYTHTLIVPTDRYFIFNTPHLNDICFPGLMNLVNLIKLYPGSTIYVAGFTDDVGSRHHKNKLSQAQAEAMLTFLWANHIPAQLLHAEGYGDKHAVGDNQLIHGSAYNRRIEIQWFKETKPVQKKIVYAHTTK